MCCSRTIPAPARPRWRKRSHSRSTHSFKRIQFTPDLLPSDILGVSIFNPQTQGFEFHFGPVFTHILLADEINRASPRTQSALLEAMAEHQVSVDGTRHDLAEPFFVIATQNPVELHGTYPLPEAQMDRFALRLALGYVSPEDEVAHPVGAESHASAGRVATLCIRGRGAQRAALAGRRARVRRAQALHRGAGRGHPPRARGAAGREPARIAGADEAGPGARARSTAWTS